eukprot:601468-Heterocapsa_arctica.AAC.1
MDELDIQCTGALRSGPRLNPTDSGLWRAIQSGATWTSSSLVLATLATTTQCPHCDCPIADWQHRVDGSCPALCHLLLKHPVSAQWRSWPEAVSRMGIFPVGWNVPLPMPPPP